MSQKQKQWLPFIAIIIVVLALDQLSKRWIVDHLLLGEARTPIPALNDYFRIVLSENTGSAFGLGQGGGDIFLVIAVIVVTGMILYYPRIPMKAVLTRLAFGMVIGGAAGNVVDRLEYGHVVDFINYRIPNVISNVSNIADHAIVLGVFLILLDSWRLDRSEKRAKGLSDTDDSRQTDPLIMPSHTLSKQGETESQDAP